MPLRANDMQTTGLKNLVMAFLPIGLDGSLIASFRQFRFEIAAQHNISAAASHISCDSDRTRPPCLLHDQRFTFMLLCIQDFVLDALFVQNGRQQLRGFDRRRAH